MKVGAYVDVIGPLVPVDLFRVTHKKDRYELVRAKNSSICGVRLDCEMKSVPRLEGATRFSWESGRPVNPKGPKTNLEFFCLQLFTWEDCRKDETRKASPETWFLVLKNEPGMATYGRIGVGHYFGKFPRCRDKLVESVEGSEELSEGDDGEPRSNDDESEWNNDESGSDDGGSWSDDGESGSNSDESGLDDGSGSDYSEAGSNSYESGSNNNEPGSNNEEFVSNDDGSGLDDIGDDYDPEEGLARMLAGNESQFLLFEGAETKEIRII